MDTITVTERTQDQCISTVNDYLGKGYQKQGPITTRQIGHLTYYEQKLKRVSPIDVNTNISTETL